MNNSIVLISGGLDSIVSLGLAKEEYNVTFGLTFDYGQKSAKEEIETGIMVDNTAPEVTVTVKSDKEFVKAGDIVEYVIASNEECTIDKSKITVDGGTIKGDIVQNADGSLTVKVEAGSGSGKLELTVGEGTLTDKAGNTNAEVANSSISVDNTAPVINQVTINNGAETTDSVVVTVQNSITEADYIFVTNEAMTKAEVEDAKWYPYTEETLHELTQGDGDKTIYVWAKDEAGNIAGPKEASITVEVKVTGGSEDKMTDASGNTSTQTTGTDTFIMTFKVTDENFHDAKIAASNLELYIGGEKDSSVTFSNLTSKAITNGREYTVTVKGTSKDGVIGIGLRGVSIRDKAENEYTASVTPVITEIVADNTAPTLEASKSGNTIQITVEDEHIIGVMVNGQLVGENAGKYSYEAVESGTYEIKAIDKAGNTATRIITK